MLPGPVVPHPCLVPGKMLESEQKPGFPLNLLLDVRPASSLSPMPGDSWSVGSETLVLALAWKLPFAQRVQELRAGPRGKESTLIQESHSLKPRVPELPHVGMRGVAGSRRETCTDAGGPCPAQTQRRPGKCWL